ncbi:hypothetical protein L1887_48401 [Cichorium endivia]|nr:hypothetical protein L1887_48401 [Cichorium endivia]
MSRKERWQIGWQKACGRTLEGALLGALDGLGGGLVEAVKGKDLEVGVLDEFFCLLLVRALQTHDERDGHVEFLGGLDDALCDLLARDNAAKDVDKDALHLVRVEQQLKRLFDRSGRGGATDVEEVGRVAAVELEHIHGSHGKTGAVDEAANVAVELDEVEAVLGRLDLVRGPPGWCRAAQTRRPGGSRRSRQSRAWRPCRAPRRPWTRRAG